MPRASTVLRASRPICAQEADAARRDIRGRRIEQRAMIGEGNVVEIVIGVVGIEGAPAAVAALHAHDPFRGSVDGAAIAGAVEAVERHRHHGGVVDIGIMRVGVLEGPAAGPHTRPPRRPVADDVEHLALGPASRARAAPPPRPRAARPPSARARQVRYPTPARRKAGNRTGPAPARAACAAPAWR